MSSSRPSPPFQTVTPSQARKNLALRRFQTVTPEMRVTARNRLKPAENLACDGVTV